MQRPTVNLTDAWMPTPPCDDGSETDVCEMACACLQTGGHVGRHRPSSRHGQTRTEGLCDRSGSAGELRPEEGNRSGSDSLPYGRKKVGEFWYVGSRNAAGEERAERGLVPNGAEECGNGLSAERYASGSDPIDVMARATTSQFADDKPVASQHGRSD